MNMNSDIEDLRNDVEFTLVSNLLLLRAFLPLIRASTQKKIMVLTSSLGSIEIAPNLPGLANTYSVSKAALNMYVNLFLPRIAARAVIRIPY